MKTVILFQKLFISFLCMNLISSSVSAAGTGGMIATSTVVDGLSRTQMYTQIEHNIQNSKLGEELQRRGVSSAEVSERLASLSDLELRQLAVETKQARYGGDILISILVVILIIFLIKRI